jgi:dTDP-4-dehydrorhamnose 3,5-epimerase
VQDNLSRSARGILRGLHLQHPAAQGKLVYVLEGEVFDVAVDVRVGSPSFGRWAAATLSSRDHRQVYIPPGFAHGFCVVSESALFAYKCTEPYAAANEVGVAWNDPALGIPWPMAEPVVSDKDRAHLPLARIDPARLPRWAGR